MTPLAKVRPIEWWVDHLRGMEQDAALQFVFKELKSLPDDVETDLYFGTLVGRDKAGLYISAGAILGTEEVFKVIIPTVH